jgi:hypothetical protein
MTRVIITVVKYSRRHGGPFDRGGADFYYGRGKNPHFYVGDTGTSERIDMVDMDMEEIDAYLAGYEAAEKRGDRKDW